MASEQATAPPSGVAASRLFPVLLTVIGLVAGACAWFAISQRIDFEYLPPEIIGVMGRPTPEEQVRIYAAVRARDLRTAATSFAILGTALGSLIGLAVGLGRSKAAAVAGLASGLVAGAICGAAGGAAGQLLLGQLGRVKADPILRTTAAVEIAFAITGIGVGVAAGIASRRAAPLLVAVAAAFIGGLIYPLLAAALFPTLPTDKVVPWQDEPLLVWAMVPAGIIGLAVGRAARHRRR